MLKWIREVLPMHTFQPRMFDNIEDPADVAKDDEEDPNVKQKDALKGRHCVDLYGYRDMEAESEEDETAGKDSMEMEDCKEKGDNKTRTNQDIESKKRKAPEDPESPEKKKKESPAEQSASISSLSEITYS